MDINSLLTVASQVQKDLLPRSVALGDLPGADSGGLLGPAKTSGFAEALSKAATSVVTPQQDAARVVKEFSHGADGELHKTMLTMERADITLKFFVGLRNKCMEAYREIMHMGS
jgi:flagellar hook-basal body complex protein FliE